VRGSKTLPWFAFALAALLLCAAAASAGGREEEQSSVERLRPAVEGIDIAVVGGDRFLTLTNDSGKVVLVKGYDDEPYLRFLASGVVQENRRSPSKYVNDDRFGLTPVPAIASSGAEPVWRTVSDNGTYRWFDHRTHSMDKGIPPQVKDPAQRTKIFDWNVPMEVGGAPVTALGTLEWVPESESSDDGGLSTGAIAAIAAGVILLLAALAYLLSRRRRRTVPAVAAGGVAPPPEADQPEEKEAW
jgi:LPXTG-motif cell wall-anchored protein